MASHKSGRKTNKVDYKEFSEKGLKRKEVNKDTDSEEEDEVDLGLDLTGEHKLCGSIQGEESEYSELEEELDEEESELEDGEMSGQESEDPEVEECIAKQDLVQLRKILRRREEECKKLQKGVNYEKEKVQKDKEMKELLGKITKVSRTRDSLRRSLVNSRAASPVPAKKSQRKEEKWDKERQNRDFVNTCLLVHKHVKISVDKWILETTRPHKHVTMFGIFLQLFLFRTNLE